MKRDYSALCVEGINVETDIVSLSVTSERGSSSGALTNERRDEQCDWDRIWNNRRLSLDFAKAFYLLIIG